MTFLKSIKDRPFLVGVALNIAAWNLGVFLFLWLGSRPSPVENYGIIAGWGLALYAAAVYRTPFRAVPLSVLIYFVWSYAAAIVGVQPISRDFPATIYALIVVGRGLVFASPIVLNWVVQRVVKRTSWLNSRQTLQSY